MSKPAVTGTAGTATIPILYPPHPKTGLRKPIGNQRWFSAVDVLPQTFRYFLGGLGSGKTLNGAVTILRGIIENPGCLGMVCAKDSKQAKRNQIRAIEDICDDILAETGNRLIVRHNRSDNYLVFANGFTLYYFGTDDADKLRGPNITLIWCDESRDWMNPNYAFGILIGRLRGEGAKSKRLLFLVTSSPAGKTGPIMHWVSNCDLEVMPDVKIGRDRREELGDPDADYSDWLIVKMKSDANTALRREYLATMSQIYDDKFLSQERDAELIDLEGKVYSTFSQAIWPMGNVLQNWRLDPRRHEVWVAIDWGIVYPHVLWIAHDPSPRSPNDPTDIIFDEFVGDGEDVREVIALIKDKEALYGGYVGLTPDKRGKSENALLRRALPGVDMFKKSTRDEQLIRSGVFLMRGLLRSHNGVRRLVVTAELARTKANTAPGARGIVQSIVNYDFKRDRMGRVDEGFKDDSWYVHGADACRYHVMQQHRATQSATI